MGDAQLWAMVVVNVAAILVSVGTLLQGHREYGRRITRLEEGKVDKAVHDEVIERIDGNVLDLKRQVDRLSHEVSRAIGRRQGDHR